MLSYRIVFDDGEAQALDNVLTCVLDVDTDVPADSLTLTCTFDERIRAHADKIEAYCADKLVFSGQLDNISCVKRGMGVILKLDARSRAAALLDNEAEPQTYRNPTMGLIERRHLAPFGLRFDSKDDVPYSGMLAVGKGMTHWQVLRGFFLNRFQRLPRVNPDGTVCLPRQSLEEPEVFSDTGEGTVYFWLKEARRRHRLLSEVRLKFRQKNTYRASLKNTNPAAKSISRVRFVNAAADNATVSTAEKMLENSNRDSYVVTLRCIGCHAEMSGKSAVLRDSRLGETNGLTVAKVRVTTDRKGEISEITLKKERFDVADALHNE